MLTHSYLALYDVLINADSLIYSANSFCLQVFRLASNVPEVTLVASLENVLIHVNISLKGTEGKL